MDQVNLGSLAFDGYGSRGVTMTEVLQSAEVRVHLATFTADSLLGRHRAGLAQLFTVVSGSGWVQGEGDRLAISAGGSVRWQVGEEHESGSDLGMSVLIVQQPNP